MNCDLLFTMRPYPDSVVWFWWTVVLLVSVVAIPAQGQRYCHIDCGKDCHTDSPTYQPQRCDVCCKGFSSDVSESRGAERSELERLTSLESSVAELKVITGVLLALVVILILAVAVLILHQCNQIPANIESFVVFRNKKNNAGSAEKTPQKTGNGLAINGKASRIANHQSNSSPQSKRASLHREVSLSTEVETQPRPLRVRQPSESTCPEEEEVTEPQGYDNLAISTSTINTTLHNTSNSSTDTLGPTLSASTLQTTLPSLQPYSSHAHNTRV